MPAYHTRQGSFLFGRSILQAGWGWPGTGRDRLLSLWHRPPVREPVAFPPAEVGHSAAVSGQTSEGVDPTQHRNPLLLFLLFGWLWLRYAERALSRLLIQEPPRSMSGPSLKQARD